MMRFCVSLFLFFSCCAEMSRTRRRMVFESSLTSSFCRRCRRGKSPSNGRRVGETRKERRFCATPNGAKGRTILNDGRRRPFGGKDTHFEREENVVHFLARDESEYD